MIEARAEGIVGIVHSHRDVRFIRGIGPDRRAPENRSCAIEHDIRKKFDSAAERVVDKRRRLPAVRLVGETRAEIHIVEIILFDAVDRTRRRGLARPDGAVGQRRKEERTGDREREIRRRLRGRDAAVRGRAGTGKTTIRRRQAANPTTERRDRGAVVEIIVAHHQAVGIGDRQSVPRGGNIPHVAEICVPRPPAILGGQGIAMEKIDRGAEMGLAAMVEFSPRDGGAVFVAPAVLRHRRATSERRANVTTRKNVVDHASRRVGTVDGRGSVAENLGTGEERGGDRIDVGRQRGRAALGLADRMRCHASTVDQRECAARSETAEIDRDVVPAGVLADDVEFAEGGWSGLRERLEHLGHRRSAPQIELLDVDHGHGQYGFLLDAADVGAGDDEGLHHLRLHACGGGVRRGGRWLRSRLGENARDEQGEDQRAGNATNATDRGLDFQGYRVREGQSGSWMK